MLHLRAAPHICATTNPKKDDLATDKRRMLWMIFEVHQQPNPCAQRWSTTKSREGRLSYRQASDAVDDKRQRVDIIPLPLRFPWSSWTLRIKKALFMSSQQLQRQIFHSHHAGPRCQRSRGLSRRGAWMGWQPSVSACRHSQECLSARYARPWHPPPSFFKCWTQSG